MVLDRGLTWETFRRQFDALHALLNGIGKLYLRWPGLKGPGQGRTGPAGIGAGDGV
jgi:hypothetical protein